MNSKINSNEAVNNTESNEVVNPTSVLTQSHKHPSRSEKYFVVETGKVIEAMEKEGFTWEKVAEERSRGSYKGFGTHLVCFQHPDLVFGDDLDLEISPRLYFKNSYHGRSKCHFDFGLIRFYCMNGLIMGNRFKSINFRHIGDKSDELKTAIDEMKRVYKEQIGPFIKALMTTTISESQAMEFAELALAERMRSNPTFLKGDHLKLLEATRPGDKGMSLWLVLQRIQENLGLNFRGSPVDLYYSYSAEDKEGNPIEKERKLKKLKNIKEVTYLNKWLFDEVSKYLPEDKQISINL